MFAAPHRRLNRLTGQSVLVSPHRTDRPWRGQVDDAAAVPSPRHDPGCFLCPGNRRAGGALMPDYPSTFVFDNDFAALVPGTPASRLAPGSLLAAESERGLCRVLCYSPRHDLSLSRLDDLAVRQVVRTWIDQYAELSSISWASYVLLFENRGAQMGASSPHPHGQIWVNESLPHEIQLELHHQRAHAENGGCLLCDYLAVELAEEERLVCQNQWFAAVVPFWATWPFETLVLPRRHLGALPDLAGGERDGLGEILQKLTRGYDRLFDIAFPYSMGFHSQPADGGAHPEWHLHAHFYPPLLRSATVRKFMVGYELLAQPQRDITPEDAARRLREAVAG